METIKIILADDHTLFREGVRKLLENLTNIKIVAEASSGKELLEMVNKVEHNLILTDISMPDGTGTEIIEQLTTEGEMSSKVLFLSMHTSEEYIYYAIKSGGNGFVSKGITQSDLLEAINKIMNDENYFLGLTTEEQEKIIKKYELKENTEAKINHNVLSNRELEILTLIAEGFTSNEIADKFLLSKRTIDNHRSNIMNKLELTSLPELLKYAIEFKYNNQSQF